MALPVVSLTVSGVGAQVVLPDATWAAALAPLYHEFPLSGAVDWHVTLRYDPALPRADPPWIRHDQAITRFHLHRIAGEIDFAAQQIEVTSVSVDMAASALERAVAYGVLYSLLRRNGLLLHAAGIQWQGRGLIVAGHSGAGKTTLARLAVGHAQPFNDEIVIADLAGPQPLLRSTPFLGFGTPPELQQRICRTCPATLLLLPAHGSEFALQPLEPAQAVLELLRSNIAAVDRPAHATRWLELVQRLLQQVPAYRLVFYPSTAVWDFLADTLGDSPCAS
ncbi:MAG: ATP-binding protein [Caldilineales bacterium]